MILIICYEFASQRDLWSSRYQFKYIESPGIGKTGLKRTISKRQSFEHENGLVQNDSKAEF